MGSLKWGFVPEKSGFPGQRSDKTRGCPGNGAFFGTKGLLLVASLTGIPASSHLSIVQALQDYSPLHLYKSSWLAYTGR